MNLNYLQHFSEALLKTVTEEKQLLREDQDEALLAQSVLLG
ncbi:hypothetical protein [Hydrocoleum sp. CS-953]|nr:hypothetical protein [Hydrocoleum sp. CS-953]